MNTKTHWNEKEMKKHKLQALLSKSELKDLKTKRKENKTKDHENFELHVIYGQTAWIVCMQWNQHQHQAI